MSFLSRLLLVCVAGLACADADSAAPTRREEGSDAKADEALQSLGRKLFFDGRLSRDGSVRCATCHDPGHGWSSPERIAAGVGGKRGERHPLSLYNVGSRRSLFWDGRTESLEEQVLQPIESDHEMALPLTELIERLFAADEYRDAFDRAGVEITQKSIAAAIAAFCRSIVAVDTPFERYRQGELAALSAPAQRGHDLFFFGLNCGSCHTGPQLTDEKFHNLGIGTDADPVDAGRFVVTGSAEHQGAFRTPSLINVAKTAPYMHDGRFEKLEEVVDFYQNGAIANPRLDPLINVMPISDEQKADLIAFLKEGLTSPSDPAAEAAEPYWNGRGR